MITVRFDDAGVQRGLRELVGLSRRPRQLLQAAARSARGVLVSHFGKRNQVPNALGGRRTHFWAEVAKSTQVSQVTDQSATITIGDSRFPQRLFGGVLRPKAAKALTIPIHAVAHGRTAGEMAMRDGRPLFQVKPAGSRQVFLARTQPDGEVQFLYVLKRSVTQKPDPNALPTNNQMAQAAVSAADRQLQVELARRKIS